jgi:hypothetical protein
MRADGELRSLSNCRTIAARVGAGRMSSRCVTLSTSARSASFGITTRARNAPSKKNIRENIDVTPPDCRAMATAKSR